MSDLLTKGTPSLSSSGSNTLRYELTDAVHDPGGNRTFQEVTAIGALLHPRIVELALHRPGRLNGTEKWAPRLLQEKDSGLADRCDRAFQTLFTNDDVQLVSELVEAELAPHGETLFDGDGRLAPDSWRVI
ncbi:MULTISPECIES: hypothetical protein [Asaia]|uniref:hypothetical protein n=1 Tax=Asaia TaxID=91914 RepID=UPI00285CEBE9|nr:hypothetical protein [Asaia bogorensis]MDR6182961.1 hypothetical protein [Asaia bogorensis NBRC 16594]